MKGTGAKRNVCPGSCVSTGAKFPVAPVESAPMHALNATKDLSPHHGGHTDCAVCFLKIFINNIDTIRDEP